MMTFIGLVLSASILHFVSAVVADDPRIVVIKCATGLVWIAIAMKNLERKIKENIYERNN